MTDESELQLTPRVGNSSLSIAKLKSNLVARGLNDAAALPIRSTPEVLDALSEIRRLANEGNASAAETLGYLFYDGTPGHLFYDGTPGPKQDFAEAVKWFLKSTRSEFGYPEFFLGMCYFYGAGVQQDYGEAARWLLEALQTEIGGRDIDEIGYLLSRIFALDEPVKQICWPTEGQGFRESYTDDVSWHRERAEKGKTYSQFCLGLAYSYGLGVTRDETEAVRWWRKAADGGETWAQFHLAVAYANGHGVPQDFVPALMWVNLAGSRVTERQLPELLLMSSIGDRQEFVSCIRDVVARKMTAPQITEAERLFNAWKPRI